MIRILLFNALFLICIGYALIKGGRPERSVAIIFCAARLLSDLVLYFTGSYYQAPEIGEIAVDGMTFGALVWVALAADRFWPMLVAAMQGVSLLAHLGRLIAYDILQTVYLNAVQLWAYPQLVVLALGTARVDLRRRNIRAGWWPLASGDIA